MSSRKVRWVLAALTAVTALFVAVGGPATAKRWIDGASVKPGTIGTRQIANGAVTPSKLSRSAKRALAGRAGAKGDTGPKGDRGATGATGPAGALNVVDADGRLVGLLTGWDASGNYDYLVYTSDGALLTYEPRDSENYPEAVQDPTLYYTTDDCTGTAYGHYVNYPLETAILLGDPPIAGTPIYVLEPGAKQTLTYASEQYRSTSCTRASGILPLLVAKPAGTVPDVRKPFSIVPAS